MLIRSGALDILVIDSVAALTPRAEIEGEMGDTHVGLQARLMSQALRKLTGTLSKSDTIAIFINQLREKIGVMFGSPETTPGGRALKFYSSVRLDIRRIESIKDGTDVVGNRTRVKVVKNKCSAPFKQAEFDIMYGKGISREGSLLDVAIELGFVKKSGAWFTYEGEQLGSGPGERQDVPVGEPAADGGDQRPGARLPHSQGGGRRRAGRGRNRPRRRAHFHRLLGHTPPLTATKPPDGSPRPQVTGPGASRYSARRGPGPVHVHVRVRASGAGIRRPAPSPASGSQQNGAMPSP